MELQIETVLVEGEMTIPHFSAVLAECNVFLLVNLNYDNHFISFFTFHFYIDYVIYDCRVIFPF